MGEKNLYTTQLNINSKITVHILSLDKAIVAAGINNLPEESPYIRCQFADHTVLKGETNSILRESCQWFKDYFNGKEPSHKALPFVVKGTAFQRKVWDYLLTIPYGEMVEYGTIAHSLGSPKAARAVGSAVGKNPLTIIIPCHRVIGKNGPGGYSGGGIPIKRLLLRQEKVVLEKDPRWRSYL